MPDASQHACTLRRLLRFACFQMGQYHVRPLQKKCLHCSTCLLLLDGHSSRLAMLLLGWLTSIYAYHSCDRTFHFQTADAMALMPPTLSYTTPPAASSTAGPKAHAAVQTVPEPLQDPEPYLDVLLGGEQR